MSSAINVASSATPKLYTPPLPYPSPSLHAMGWGDLRGLIEVDAKPECTSNVGAKKCVSELASPQPSFITAPPPHPSDVAAV